MRSLFLCAFFIAALSACGHESENERQARAFEKEMEWVDTANASQQFKADTSRGRLRFLSVCGATCMIPGVDILNAEKCYPDVLVEKIPGTGDVFLSKRQQELQERAWEFSRDYNLLVASSESMKGKSTCDNKEDWDGGFIALSKALQSLSGVSDFRSERLVSIAKNSKTFEVILPREIPMNPLKKRTCAALADHGLSRAAKIMYRIDDNKKSAWQEIICSVQNAT